MPKYRQLHVKIIDSFDFSEMPDDFTRVIWLLLIVSVDSEGRGIYNMAWIKSKMFPLRQDVTLNQLEKSFEWLRGRKMIEVYPANDREYFHIPNFKKYQSGTQRESASVLPDPPSLVSSNSEPTHELLTSNSEEDTDKVCMGVSVLYCIESVFKVYEKEIGIITPSISDRIIEAEKNYPIEWIPDALKEAAKNNKRSWGYAEGILKRWKTEGRGAGKPNGSKPNPKDPRDRGLEQYG
jgi:DnaD/phage-associated family protein